GLRGGFAQPHVNPTRTGPFRPPRRTAPGPSVEEPGATCPGRGGRQRTSVTRCVAAAPPAVTSRTRYGPLGSRDASNATAWRPAPRDLHWSTAARPPHPYNKPTSTSAPPHSAND